MLKGAVHAADVPGMGMIAGVAYVDNGTTEPKTRDSGRRASTRADRVPPMRRLLTPVNAGVNAARHMLWYISYHAKGTPGR
jgi:hypothetical protein